MQCVICHCNATDTGRRKKYHLTSGGRADSVLWLKKYTKNHARQLHAVSCFSEICRLAAQTMRKKGVLTILSHTFQVGGRRTTTTTQGRPPAPRAPPENRWTRGNWNHLPGSIYIGLSLRKDYKKLFVFVYYYREREGQRAGKANDSLYLCTELNNFWTNVIVDIILFICV